MRKRLALGLSFLGVSFVFFPADKQAQSHEPLKFEVGAEFTSLSKPNFDGARTEPGFGGRFTFNLNKTVALEAATYFFPHKCVNCSRSNGTTTEGLFGVKVGKRFEKWGIFAKARPGFASFSQGDFDHVAAPPSFFNIVFRRSNHFAFDLGGVVEFYPAKRIVTRFEAGDTMIHFKRRIVNFPVFDPAGNVTFQPFPLPATTTHNFQFTAGVGFRF